VGGEKGSADSARDPRGFSIKFYTEEGIWDMVSFLLPSTPIVTAADFWLRLATTLYVLIEIGMLQVF